MGSRYDWVCSDTHCTGKIKAISGGRDRDFSTFYNTLSCTKCGHVADYAVNEAESYTGPKSKRPDNQPNCKKCWGATIPWNRTCPECGKPMVADEHGYFELFD